MTQLFYGTVALCSADNPAANALGGFKESASAYRHCRQCLGTAEETKTEVHSYIHVYIYTKFDYESAYMCIVY